MFGMQEKHASLLDHFDVKSLRLLAALLDTESISRAGDALQLSQPAASRAVARMRQLLGDRLLVRTSKGYTLTNRAKALKPQVEAVLAALEQLFEAEGFDPATSRRTFRIAATDYGSITILDRLVTQLARQAPSLALDIVPFGSHTLADLESGALDCAVDAAMDVPADFHYRELFQDEYACLVRRGHPCLAGAGSLPERLAAAPRAVMMYPEGNRLLPDDVLLQLGMAAGNVGLRTPYFMSAPWFLAETDLVICLPRRAALKLANAADLQVVPLPESPRFSFGLLWHERVHRDPGMRWFRDWIVTADDPSRQAQGQAARSERRR